MTNNFDMSLFNKSAPIEEPEPKQQASKGRRGKGKDVYNIPIPDNARADAAKASGDDSTIVGGNKKRTTVLIRLDQLDDIETVGGKIGISRNGFVQWGIDLALEAAAKGQVPPMEDFVRRRYAGGK